VTQINGRVSNLGLCDGFGVLCSFGGCCKPPNALHLLIKEFNICLCRLSLTIRAAHSFEAVLLFARNWEDRQPAMPLATALEVCSVKTACNKMMLRKSSDVPCSFKLLP